MRSFLTGSIVFRLWAALSIVATVFTTVALVTYTWLAIDDFITNAQEDVDARVQVSLVRMARVGLTAEPPTAREVVTASGLGIARTDLLGPDGSVRLSVDFLEDEVTGSILTTDQILAGETRRTVRIADDGQLIAHSVSPWDVVRGGRFGEERIESLESLAGGAPGYVRTFILYPDLTAEANAQILRSIGTGFLIILAILAGMWPLLNGFVAKPLRRYSALALRIAAGEPARMPVHDRGELGDLGRAVNAMAETLQQQATVDTLTGLYNLRHLGANLEGIIAEAKAANEPLSLVLADLDNLKPVNDTFGHQAGDEILRSVSAALKSWAQPRYTVWRLGGDEFVLALPKVTAAQAQRCGEELKAIVAAMIVPIDNTLVRPSISVGVAHCPEDGASAGELIGVADRRMYEEKARRVEEKRILLVS